MNTNFVLSWWAEQKEMISMKGIQFLVDKKGKKKSVLIDLQEHSDIWEDFFDSLTARSRAHEQRESLAEVRKSLKKRGKLCE